MKSCWGAVALGMIGGLISPWSLAAVESAAEIVRELTYQTHGANRAERGIFNCGSIGRWEHMDRARANELVRLGDASLPELEHAFDSILNKGEESPFAWNSAWLFYAYAGIKRQGAYPRLAQLIESSPSEFSRFYLDISVALALGLTSYVDSSRSPGIPLLCRRATPRDSLDELIIAWMRRDRAGLESTLGPTAKAALRSAIENSNWRKVQRTIWTTKVPRGAAVGYRFEVSGGWSEPWQTLGEQADEEAPASVVNLATNFTGRTGYACGSLEVLFVPAPNKVVFTNPFLVDNPDILELLQLISACAGHGGQSGR